MALSLAPGGTLGGTGKMPVLPSTSCALWVSSCIISSRLPAMLPVPVLLQGGCHVDARGSISFVNGFTFAGVERFYWIQSNHVGMQRGWVGHQREHKWFTVVAGEVQMAVVRPDDWPSPSSDLPVARYVLYAARPQVLS